MDFTDLHILKVAVLTVSRTVSYQLFPTIQPSRAKSDR